MPFMTSHQGPIFKPYSFKIMNEKAEQLNGRVAMLGVIAAIGAYALTGQLIPGIF